MNIAVDLQAQQGVARMQEILARQRSAALADGVPSAQIRIDRLQRCIDLLVQHDNALCDAMAADFGWRSKDASRLGDIAASIGALKHARSQLTRWMRPQTRRAEFPLGLLGARAQVKFQPKGVVGLISPWNFPVQLTFGPLAGVLAAGNRALIKPSEFTPQTSALMQSLIAAAFAEEEMAVVTGGPEIGAAFAGLPFDHLLFTGATSVGRHVMRAAAEHLTPVTLELGGKSPVLIGRSANLELAALRIMAGKTLNAGQICLAPDYVLAPQGSEANLVAALRGATAKLFPTMKDNPDYTSVINQRHYERLNALVTDAEAKGAKIERLNPAGEDFSQQEHRRMEPILVLNPSEDMKVMQDEIFGPILPIKTYASIGEAIGYINAHPRPLGLYYFGSDAAEEAQILDTTTSGGVTINDVVFHVAQEDLPFGGVGPSGMGAYHGHDGFMEFSHKKAVYRQIGADLLAVTRPPYGAQFRKLISGRITK
jgi:coniferyl-aldehyde dehydrogenase